MKQVNHWILIVVPALSSVAIADADDSTASPVAIESEQRASMYHTREEKREAGLGAKLTDWLTLSGLIEIEALSIDNSFRDNIGNTGHDKLESTVQIGLDVSVSEEVDAEIILEYSEDSTDTVLDEAIINFDRDGLGINIGRLYVPFGIYYSHFVTGPMLEFGETRASTIVLGYDYNDMIETSVYVFNGVADKVDAEDRINDWGVSIEAHPLGDILLIGAGFLSDLADTDDLLLEDNNNNYQRRVGGWNAYTVMQMDYWEVSMEFLQATRAFNELDENANKPAAWNVEFAYFPRSTMEVAARIEGSRELADEPQRQYGAALTWRIYKNTSLTLEYLYGKYKKGFVFDDDDNELHKRNLIAGQLALEF